MKVTTPPPSDKPRLSLKFPPKNIPKPQPFAPPPPVKAKPQPPKKAKPPQPELPKKARQRKNMMHLRGWLIRKHPKCFMLFGQPKLPLKIGIYDDIMALYGGGYQNFRFELSAALSDYCNGGTYLRALVVGAVRVDLDGNPAGEVSEAAAQHAVERLAKLEAKS